MNFPEAIFAALALVSLALLFWQWSAARRFPLHRRVADSSFAPAITLLKPLKGSDATTAESLQSWFNQNYAGQVQFLFGAADAHDPAASLVRELIARHPGREAQLVVCAGSLGANGKVSAHYNPVDGHGVPVPHCGVVLEMDEWSRLAETLRGHGVQFLIEPHIRFAGQSGEQAQNAQDPQGKGTGKSENQQPSKQPGSGIGSQDGDKSIKQAEQLAAMGKISEIFGKRSANITGEATVEVQNTSQQLRTPYAQRGAQHTQAGAEINRDEIPVVLQTYVEQYFEQVRKQQKK